MNWRLLVLWQRDMLRLSSVILSVVLALAVVLWKAMESMAMLLCFQCTAPMIMDGRSLSRLSAMVR